MQAKITGYVNSTRRNEEEKSLPELEISSIPEDWEAFRLGDLVKYEKGRKPERLFEVYKVGYLPYLTAEYFRGKIAKQFVDAKNETSIVRVSIQDIVLIWDGSNAGDVFTGLEGVLASTMVRIEPNNQLIKPFLYYFLKTKFIDLNEKTTGSTIPHVSKTVFENLTTPCPPILEQQKIVKVLGTIQKSVELQDGVIQATKNLKKSAMRKLFTEGMGHTEFKEMDIGVIPASWDVVKLGDLLTLAQYGLSLRGSKEGKYPILRMNNLANGYVDLKDLQFVNIDEEQTFSKFKLEKGDVLFNRTNSIDLVGKTSIFILNSSFVFASYLIRLKTNPEKLNPYFLNYHLNWDISQIRLKGLASRGVSQANISATRLKTLEIRLPPLHEQQEIASILSKIDKKIEVEERRKVTLMEFFKSMLHKLMTGEIRLKDVEV